MKPSRCHFFTCRAPVILWGCVFLLVALSESGCRRATSPSENADDSEALPLALPKRAIVPMPRVATGTGDADIVVHWRWTDGLLFSVHSSRDTLMLYHTDGTVAGTQALHQFHNDNHSVEIVGSLIGDSPDFHFTVQFRLLSDKDIVLEEKWVSDGTTSGTTPFEWRPDEPRPPCPLEEGEDTVCQPVVEQNGMRYWLYNEDQSNPDNSYTLWRTDERQPNPVQMLRGSGAPVRLNMSYSTSDGPLFAMRGDDLYLALPGEPDVEQRELHRLSPSAIRTETLLSTPQQLPATDCRLSWPSQFAVLNETLLFTWCDQTHGFELWRTDGTADGTQLLKDVKAGAISSLIDSFTVSGDLMYFVFRNPAEESDDQMWRTDGTPEGTFMVADIGSDAELNDISDIYTPESYHLQAAADSAHAGAVCWQMPLLAGGDVWFSDGTVSGTHSMTESIDGTIYTVHTSGAKTYFTSHDNTSGEQLWVFDSNDTTVHHLLDVRKDPAGMEHYCCVDEIGVIEAITSTPNGTVYFIADDGIHGLELWTTDGTAAGTLLLGDFNASGATGFLWGYTGLQEHYFFSGNDQVHGRELWVANLNNATVERLTDNPPGMGFNDVTEVAVLPHFALAVSRFAPALQSFSLPAQGGSGTDLSKVTGGNFKQQIATTPSGDGYVMTEDDSNGTPYFDCVLWKTNGQPAGTVRIAETSCGGDQLFNNDYNAEYNRFLTAGDLVFYGSRTDPAQITVFNDATQQHQLFSSAINHMQSIGFAGNHYFFVADQNDSATYVDQLYVTDLSGSPAHRVFDFPELPDSPAERFWLIWNDDVYVGIATSRAADQLWRVDGETLVTTQVSQNPASSKVSIALTTPHFLYLAAELTDDSGVELWRLPRDADVAKPLPELNPGEDSSYPLGIAGVGRTAYFWAYTGNTAETPRQRSLVRIMANGDMHIISPPLLSVDDDRDIRAAGQLGCYFYLPIEGTGDHQPLPDENLPHGHPNEIWELNGCEETLTRLPEPPGAALHDIQILHQSDFRILFSALNGENGRELYVIQ